MSGERDWFAERADGGEEHPVDAGVRLRIGEDYARVDKRIVSLKHSVARSLGERVATWLELEELLNERATVREMAYYNVGVDDGRAVAFAEELLGSERAISPREALRVVGEAGARLADLSRRALASAPPAARVLVVDDDHLIALSVARLLRMNGFEVESAASAHAALIALEGEPFDAILTDYQMPGGDGVSLLRESARRAPGVRRLLTSSGEIEGLDELIRGRVVERFLPKLDLATELIPTLRRGAAPDERGAR